MFLAEQNNNCQNEDKDAKKTSQDCKCNEIRILVFQTSLHFACCF